MTEANTVSLSDMKHVEDLKTQVIFDKNKHLLINCESVCYENRTYESTEILKLLLNK